MRTATCISGRGIWNKCNGGRVYWNASPLASTTGRAASDEPFPDKPSQEVHDCYLTIATALKEKILRAHD
jgi:hypothetical protein